MIESLTNEQQIGALLKRDRRAVLISLVDLFQLMLDAAKMDDRPVRFATAEALRDRADELER